MRTKSKETAYTPEKPLTPLQSRPSRKQKFELPLKAPKLSKEISPLNFSKCLEYEDELDSSLQESFVQSTVPEDHAKDLLLQTDAFRSVLESYESYLVSVSKLAGKAIITVRTQFEDEYGKLQAAVDNLKDLVRQHTENLAKELLKETLDQQQSLIVENKEIEARLQEIARIKGEIIKSSEVAVKYAEEHKFTAEEEAEFKSAKAKFFDLSSDFEKAIKVKFKGVISRRTAIIDPKAVFNMSKAVRLNETYRDIIGEFHTPEILSMCEKMREIKRPVLTLIHTSPDLASTCAISKYTMGFQKISSEKATIPLGIDLENSLLITHPNGNSIYLVNGGVVTQYDSLNNTFLKKPANLSCTGITGSAITLLEHYIYVLGGYKDGKALSTAHRFNIITERWSPLAPMHVERYNAAACALGESKICIAGGENETSGALDSLEFFDVRENTWEVCSISMKVPRKLLTISSIEKDKVIACGGVGADKEIIGEVEELDLGQNVVQKLASTANPRRNANAFVIGDEVLILGGYSKTVDGSIGERYNRKTNMWNYIGINEGIIEKEAVGMLFE